MRKYNQSKAPRENTAMQLSLFDISGFDFPEETKPKIMRVLVGCEFSGTVREAFKKRGHDAWSCDILPSEIPGQHFQRDLLEVLDLGWDLMICHPPCTYLTRAGARWWKNRAKEQREALEFVKKLLNANIPRIALENPPGAIGTKVKPASQYIHPWQFGHPEKKETGLWLKGLPLLKVGCDVRAEMMLLPERLQSKIHYMAPGPDRWKLRSKTYQGIADAMAEQWG